jgi:hypothetical protein
MNTCKTATATPVLLAATADDWPPSVDRSHSSLCHCPRSSGTKAFGTHRRHFTTVEHDTLLQRTDILSRTPSPICS